MTNGERLAKIFLNGGVVMNGEGHITHIGSQTVMEWLDSPCEDVIVITPSDEPIEVALKLISAEHEVYLEDYGLEDEFGRGYPTSFFSDAELKQMAKHLLVYCEG